MADKVTKNAHKEIGLNVGDIKTIIESCAMHGVRKLKFASLEIELGQAHTVELPSEPKINLTQQHIDMDKTEKEVIASDEEELRAAALATLQIEDPLRFEEVLEKLEADGNAET